LRFFFRALGKIIDTLLNLKAVKTLFRGPVNAQQLNIPDYHDVVKRPMDLGTISKNLGDNKDYPLGDEKYISITHLLREIHLVFDNALLYNGSNSMVYSCYSCICVCVFLP
jgi:hypothetical protein